MTSYDKFFVRRHGPGRFSSGLDEYVYGVAFDAGCNEEHSWHHGGGWYGLMLPDRLTFQYLRDHDPSLEELPEADTNKLWACAGIILYEDFRGVVTVKYFGDRVKLDAAWAEIQTLFAEGD